MDLQEGLLPKPSYVRATKLYTLNECIVVRRFGTLVPETFARIHVAICTALGCR